MKTEATEVRNHGRLGAQVIWLTHDNWISSMPDLKTAELTAAAPELLEALKALLQNVDNLRTTQAANALSCTYEQLIAARAAIAKAEGTKG